MASKSYVMAVIRLMGGQRGRRFTATDLVQQLSAGQGGPIFPSWVATEHAVSGVLGELTDLGAVQSEGETWWMTEKGDGDRGLPPPGGAGGGGAEGDDDGRGGGLAEVLSHPVMFSSDDGDFDRALTAALTV